MLKKYVLLLCSCTCMSYLVHAGEAESTTATMLQETQPTVMPIQEPTPPAIEVSSEVAAPDTASSSSEQPCPCALKKPSAPQAVMPEANDTQSSSATMQEISQPAMEEQFMAEDVDPAQESEQPDLEESMPLD